MLCYYYSFDVHNTIIAYLCSKYGDDVYVLCFSFGYKCKDYF